MVEYICSGWGSFTCVCNHGTVEWLAHRQIERDNVTDEVCHDCHLLHASTSRMIRSDRICSALLQIMQTRIQCMMSSASKRCFLSIMPDMRWPPGAGWCPVASTQSRLRVQPSPCTANETCSPGCTSHRLIWCCTNEMQQLELCTQEFAFSCHHQLHIDD